MKNLFIFGFIVGVMSLSFTSYAKDFKTKDIKGFGGVIAKEYKNSKEWWPPVDIIFYIPL